MVNALVIIALSAWLLSAYLSDRTNANILECLEHLDAELKQLRRKVDECAARLDR